MYTLPKDEAKRRLKKDIIVELIDTPTISYGAIAAELGLAGITVGKWMAGDGPTQEQAERIMGAVKKIRARGK